MGPEAAFFLLIWVSSLLQLKWVVFFGCFNGFFVVYFVERQQKNGSYNLPLSVIPAQAGI